MHGNNRKDIQDISLNKIDYTYISLMSKKVRIGVIGGGKGGQIKTRHFVNNKCNVEVISKDFTQELLKLAEENEEYLTLINREFNIEFLKDKHIIVIASNDENINDIIRKYCDDNYKIYIDASDFTNGIGVVPAERSSKTMNFALNTKQGNPKGAVLMCNKIQNYISEYDDFIELTGTIRNNVKNYPEYKRDVLSYIYSSEFEEAYKRGDYIESLNERYGNDIIKKLLM
ncbi:NAD(P)-dependent oxidoreductase [Clostridium sp. SM-530-WT-3G]|uniref:NAD(P)-dependent oxidoreductase n=1 Tax=Clostridium sp. SM-530-WT-3G TaxID=2725303 RepID=UPI00145C8BE4|nr:NAD(P)-dependent oxidoreductase [Clostridium sp. SM-530-WT-3G]NME81938.1 NAD(P)-dependent oxidoreductase [Clostridium sp. SM-530-WT-3G]